MIVNSIKKNSSVDLPANQVIYEDNHLLIVNKLPGQIAQGDKTGDIPLSDLLKEYIKQKYSKPGAVFLGVVHRLDRPVSGITIFARTSKALERLNEMLRNHEIRKTYWAVVRNKPRSEEETLVQYIARNEAQNKSYVVNENSGKSLRAELSYKLIGNSQNYYLLEVTLKTGRHHQIRTQLSSIGCPIKGDLKYGFARSNPDGSIHLHARQIEFVHPVKKTPILLTADPPDDPIWNYFLTKA